MRFIAMLVVLSHPECQLISTEIFACNIKQILEAFSNGIHPQLSCESSKLHTGWPLKSSKDCLQVHICKPHSPVCGILKSFLIMWFIFPFVVVDWFIFTYYLSQHCIQFIDTLLRAHWFEFLKLRVPSQLFIYILD